MTKLTSLLGSMIFLLCLGQSAGAAPLSEVLASQSSDTKARYEARHPQQTLEFFGVEPGSTVIEVLPGRGWYSNILMPYIGPDGLYIAADYAYAMYPMFNFYSEEYLEKKRSWAPTWTNELVSKHGSSGAKVSAFVLGSMTADIDGKVDAVLLIRALHNLARFENKGGYLTTALNELHRALKSGGTVGIVQHMAPEDAPDDWANGSNGYLKKSFVMEVMKNAGFEFVAESDINTNPKDDRKAGDIVWRLPPSFATSGDDPQARAKFAAIGESTRMTLRFKKP